MKISVSETTRVYINDVDRLDPITVFLEDFMAGQGRITIVCFGQAWTAFWGGMGDSNITNFFTRSGNEYIISKLSPQLKAVEYDENKLDEMADAIGEDSVTDLVSQDYDLLSKLFGNDMMEWDDKIPKMPNPDYDYLDRIVTAVKEALESYEF